MNKIPDKEGWFWAKGRLGWTCVKVRQLAGVWVGLNPYDGKEHPLHFPDDQFWDGIEWHGEAPPPASQNEVISDSHEFYR
jgi:hypothetical protein